MTRRLIVCGLIFTMIFSLTSASGVLAVETPKCNILKDGVCMDNYYISQDFKYYDPTECAVGSSGEGNQDYKGNQILSADKLSNIAENQPFYQKAADQVGIPWEMIAVIHLRESGLGRVNPENGQGIYQDYAKSNGPYPAGPVDDAEFTRQTTWVAAFIKAKASKPELLASGDEGQIKDAFFGYNGRAGVYETQAEELGFSEGYEGSPYVMNIADEKRDPAANPSGWGQIKEDGGDIEYPANSDYGAFVVYKALTGAVAPVLCTEEGATDGSFVYYSQLDPLWRDKQLKTGLPAGFGGTYGADGCGLAANAMVVATLVDNKVTPETIAALANENGMISGSGPTSEENNSYGLTGNSVFSPVLASKYGLSVSDLDGDITKIIEYVKAGGLVVMSGRSGAGNDDAIVRQGPFSAGGHFVVVKSIDNNGNLVIANPYSVNGGPAFSPGAGHPQPWPAEQVFSPDHFNSVTITGAYGFKK